MVNRRELTNKQESDALDLTYRKALNKILNYVVQMRWLRLQSLVVFFYGYPSIQLSVYLFVSLSII